MFPFLRSRRMPAPRRRRRRSTERLAGFERLEPKTPLAVDVSLSDGTLTLAYSHSTDSATLTVDGDSFTVAGMSGTSVTGTTTGAWSSSINVLCGYSDVMLAPGATSQFTLSSTSDVSLGSLVVGGGYLPPANVTIDAPKVIGSEPSPLVDSIVINAFETIVVSGGLQVSSSNNPFPLGIALSATGGRVSVLGNINTSVTTSEVDEVGVAGNVSVMAGTDIVLQEINAEGKSDSDAGGSVSLTAGGSISYTSIDVAGGLAAGTITVDQDDSSLDSSVAASATGAAAPATASAAPAIRAGRTVGGAASIRSLSGEIYLAGDFIINGDATFNGPVRLAQPILIDSSAGGGDVTFTSTVDGRHPLAVAAGTGAIAFQGAVGATRPLAGLRFESAGSVTAAGRVNVTGGVSGAFRHGIELAPGVGNVTMTQGGMIRHFRSGQSIHIPGGTQNTTMTGFQISRSGLPYNGYLASTVLANTSVTIGFQVYDSSPAYPTPGIMGAGNRMTNDPTPTLSGRARSGDTVTLYADGVPVGSTVAVNGRWSITSAAIADGRHSFRVRSLAPSSVASAFSRPIQIQTKTTPPATPTVGLAATSDSGILGDMTTTETRPVLRGTAAPGTRVRVALDGRGQGTVTATPQGTWRLPVTAGIPGGADRAVRAISVTATDPFGNVSAAATAALTTLRIDDPVLLPAAEGSVFNPAYALTTTTGGEYVLTGSFSGVTPPASGWPVVLVYHGGGESAQEILGYSDLSALSAVVISLQGQPSINGHTWMNAFPWLYDNPRDDVAFTEQVLEEVAAQLPIDRSRIYATGKSDGGGMSVFLAAHPELRTFSVAAIAPVAGAYFGGSQTIARETFALPADAADYGDIVLAARQVPVLEMHGTADQVMPYGGGQFTTSLALQNYGQPGSFWGPANGFTNNVAYTASIESYWAAWARSVNGATNLQTRPFTNSTTQQATLYEFTRPGALPLQHLQVAGANHDWFGHGDSGPGSTTAPSLQLDATQLVADFFRIPLRNYTSPVTTGTPALPLVSTPAGVIDLSAAKLAAPTSTWASVSGVLSQRGAVRGVLGVFRVDDISGRITDPATGQSLLPGDAGWAAAALSASRSAGRIRLDPNLPAARDVTLALETGGIYGTFIAQPRRGGQIQASVSSGAPQDVTFSFPAANGVSPQYVFDAVENGLIARSAGGQAGDRPLKSIGIRFSKIVFKYTPYDPAG